MSYRDVLNDNRFVVTGPLGSALIGQYKYTYQNGANLAAGETLKELHLHPYSATYVTMFDSAYKWWKTSNPEQWGWSGVVYPSVSEKWTPNDDITLINKLKHKWDLSEWNAPVAAGELGKTVDMLADRTKQFAKALSQVKRGNFAEAARTMWSDPRSLNKKGRRGPAERQRITDAQLELQYGLRAAAGDVFNLSEAITNMAYRRRRIFVSQKVASEVVPHAFYPASSEAYVRKSIIAYIIPDEPTFAERFGLTDPLSLPWELLPWSFVIDWMMPVGDFISAQQFAWRARAEFVNSTKSYYRATGNQCTNVPPGYTIEQPNKWFRESVTFSRTIGTTISVPPPTIKSDLLGGEPLNRLANAFSLLVGLGRGWGTRI